MEKFYAVYGVYKGADYLTLLGVFSRFDDAFEFYRAQEESGRYAAVAHPAATEMRGILEDLVNARLGQLAKPILALAQERGVE